MNIKLCICSMMLFCVLSLSAQNNNSGVQFIKNGLNSQLIVDGKPFIALGGELGNSSASNMKYLKPYFTYLKSMNLNTLLVPVYWELIEPSENKFDFALVDSIIVESRKHNIKLGFLWFGTWKNSMSCYAPLWMKTNNKRFPRTADDQGRSHEIFSVFGKETLEADKKAFASLMKHIKQFDAKKNTVILVQVENEIGMLTTPREVSKTADRIYADQVPAELMQYLQSNQSIIVPELKQKWARQGNKTKGNWPTIFGDDMYTEELFQSWFYAKYANEVAVAGKKEYNLPMFVNAALPRANKTPGEYPSAGPLPHIMDIWQAAAPSIDFLSPDFYNPDTKYWCDLYVRNGNPLFIPEMKFDETVAAKAFFVIGHYNAFGFSPFSIESDNKSAIALTKSYEVLHQITPIIAAKKWLSMDGFLFDKNNKSTTVKMGNYQITVSHDNTLNWNEESKDSVWGTSGGLIIQMGTDEFIIAGTGIVATFINLDNNLVSNIATADEVKYVNGMEQLGRRMNGDQDHQGRHIRIELNHWNIQKVRLYNSPAVID